ncbi:MAG: hypothetical protein LBC96_10250 [Lachnospiraceae bacterium]|nr:hypothetical protein [Lachnospiraceae bacterium]
MKKRYLLIGLPILLCIIAFIYLVVRFIVQMQIDEDSDNQTNIWWSDSKYSEITSKHYEETANGYKAAFYNKDELNVERIKDWVVSCEPSEEYYQYIASDPDSWDMYIYYSHGNSIFGNNELKFNIEGSEVNLFVTSNDNESTTDDYILIRIQAPTRGVWPSSSTLYWNDQKIEKHGEVGY